MKKTTLILLLLTSVFGFSQDEKYSTENIAEAEMKSASKTMNMTVNSNTLNYDVTHHNLELTVDPAVYFISGKITTTFTALSNMNTITFDFANDLTVSSVKQGATNLAFVENTNNELIITLPTAQLSGTSATIEIVYSGAPPASGFSAFATDTHGGSDTPVMWTLSEPYGARDWWPCKQDLNDKITSVDIRVTAPSVYNVAANGLEQSRTINGANATTHFRHNYPIPAYLIAFAVTDYQIHNQQGGLGTAGSPFFPIVNYIYPETAASTITSLAVTPTIINLYETKIGNYPFRNEKYGHAEFGWGGGMEHTTVSFMGGWSRSLIAHEMAHQWFGDKVTCGSWKDIWLNEGITEYMSGLVVENIDGAAAFVSWKNSKINNTIDGITLSPTGNLYLYDSQLTNIGRIFSSRLSYNKGSMVTNMLRFKMGDTNFFQGLRNYLNDPALAYAYALTPQFQTHMEAVSGAPGSLQEFFNDWVYNEGYPTYTINAFNSGAGQATVQISQTQSITNPAQTGYVSYFEMPVPVRLTGASGQQLDVVLNNTTNGQIFVVPVGFTVTGILFDPNKDIISRNSTATLGIENFNYDTAINMYPNPSSDILNIDLPSNMILKKVSLYNTLGQKSLETTQNNIDVSGLSSGMYIVKFETSEGTFHKNFIKK
ncbi:Por secretion system C-terminal sorting domain-containing protein [Flavobacterium swingsii]|jgi:aminopeptidase N|uniref:Aminopeptidase N n=1 Tax=Flavobacterium swingsii TaxID=498292 RepID=A0A1I0XGT0_9FLAO|nr:M1 family aminopeptidase [Flavobacterium swingsii]SFA99458.1 Por secretion system C-terminal sorting domain-containing protein [Flavobacterium swingsii]